MPKSLAQATLAASRYRRAVAWARDGLSTREIAEELNVCFDTASRLLTQARRAGELTIGGHRARRRSGA